MACRVERREGEGINEAPLTPGGGHPKIHKATREMLYVSLAVADRFVVSRLCGPGSGSNRGHKCDYKETRHRKRKYQISHAMMYGSGWPRPGMNGRWLIPPPAHHPRLLLLLLTVAAAADPHRRLWHAAGLNWNQFTCSNMRLNMGGTLGEVCGKNQAWASARATCDKRPKQGIPEGHLRKAVRRRGLTHGLRRNAVGGGGRGGRPTQEAPAGPPPGTARERRDSKK